MNMKKLSLAVVTVCGIGSAALAADAVQLSCPAGSRQQLLAQQDLTCVGADGKAAAGPMVMLYPSGKKMAEGQRTADGFRVGTWTLFDENGVKTHVIRFNRGAFDGEWVEFHPTGQRKVVQQFQAGVRVGAIQEFDVTGKLVREVAAR